MPKYKANEVADWLKKLSAGELDLNLDIAGLAAEALHLLPYAATTLPPGYLTPHFTLAEMTYSATAQAQGINNTPNETEVAALKQTCEVLEKVRYLCDASPVLISSGFRSQALNNAVGGASNSAHRYGFAADFTIPKFGSPLDVCNALAPKVDEFGIDQLIYETSGSSVWVHMGLCIPPNTSARNQCFTIASGATVYSPFPTVMSPA